MSKPQAPAYSPFAVLLMIRDAATTQGAQRALLNAIALRCRADQQYSAFPSYACLADDTRLDEKTLRRAARCLESAELLSRKTRGNHSNRFYLNVGLLKVQADEANARRQVLKAEREANKESASPFPDAAMAKPKPGFIALEDPDENLYWDEPVQGGAR